jgi:nitrate reductase gamma subunit
MDWNNLLFMIFPYVALTVAIVVTVYRSVVRPFSISSLSSQLLERRLLYWGSIPFHWGITIILTFHVIAIFIPQSIVLWNAQPLRLYALEISGLALGLWATFGMVVLLFRRVSVARIRAVSTPMDYVVLLLIFVSLATGVAIASYYRWGSYWFTGIFTPYIVGLLTLHPNAAPLAPLPLLIKVHVFNFFLLTLAFSFSRLVHIITWPVGYLLRPWQIVVALRRVRPQA